MSYVLGSADNDYDWLYTSHDDNLWSSEQKSIYDPCPRGWRIPDGNAFVGMDIDQSEDLSELGDIRGMYGWHLVDTATRHQDIYAGSRTPQFRERQAHQCQQLRI